MVIIAADDIRRSLIPRQRLLALDVGDKTIGLALSDTGLVIATPLQTIQRRKFTQDAERLLRIIDEHGAGALVIGLPINMDGSEGRRAQSVRQFAQNLLEKRDMPILFWDERLSTAAVTRTLLESDASRKRRADVNDKMAAAYFLQGLLDRLKYREDNH